MNTELLQRAVDVITSAVHPDRRWFEVYKVVQDLQKEATKSPAPVADAEPPERQDE